MAKKRRNRNFSGEHFASSTSAMEFAWLLAPFHLRWERLKHKTYIPPDEVSELDEIAKLMRQAPSNRRDGLVE